MNNHKPILFTAPEVRAIFDGHKTQTRRVVKPANPVKSKRMGGYKQGDGLWIDGGSVKDYSISPCWQKMYYYMRDYAPCQPGDVLWVRETWRSFSGMLYGWHGGAYIPLDDFEGYNYRADDMHIFTSGCSPLVAAFEDGKLDTTYSKWRPSIHMPREAARIFLRVTDIRVERVREISEADAKAEGILTAHSRLGLDPLTHADMQKHNMPYEKLEYMHLWDTLYAKRGYGWDTNPWVWAISFERTGKPEGWPT